MPNDKPIRYDREGQPVNNGGKGNQSSQHRRIRQTAPRSFRHKAGQGRHRRQGRTTTNPTEVNQHGLKRQPPEKGQ